MFVGGTKDGWKKKKKICYVKVKYFVIIWQPFLIFERISILAEKRFYFIFLHQNSRWTSPVQ